MMEVVRGDNWSYKYISQTLLQAGCPSCRRTNGVRALKTETTGGYGRRKMHVTVKRLTRRHAEHQSLLPPQQATRTPQQRISPSQTALAHSSPDP